MDVFGGLLMVAVCNSSLRMTSIVHSIEQLSGGFRLGRTPPSPSLDFLRSAMSFPNLPSKYKAVVSYVRDLAKRKSCGAVL